MFDPVRKVALAAGLFKPGIDGRGQGVGILVGVDVGVGVESGVHSSSLPH